MAERWAPQLMVEETAEGCRLSLGALTSGSGRTLQEAADDLMARLVDLALAFRRSGFRLSSESPLADRASLEFIWEIGERASRGEDVRVRVFGASPSDH
jgi:hypothetical protein